MSIDFSLVLVIATAVTGVVWGIWLVYLRQTGQSSVTAEDRRDAGEALSPNAIREPIYVEYARSFFPVLLIVLVASTMLL